MEFLLAALVAFGIAFVLPIVSFVFAFRTRARVEDLEHTVEAQRDAIERLELRVAQLRREMETRPAAAPAARAEAPDVRPAPAPTPKPIVPTPAADRGVRPVPDQGQTVV